MSGAFQTLCIEVPAQSAQSRAMNTSWTALLIAAISAMCMADPKETRSLTVIVRDYARLPGSSISELENVSTTLFAHAGIRLEWVHCTGHRQGPSSPECDAYLKPGTVLLRILETRLGPPNEFGDPLGAAIVESGYASIYASAIQKYSDHTGLSATTLMGYAVTHEIGHLLLGKDHSSWGIMRAGWGKPEFIEMAQLWLSFSSPQQKALLLTIPASELALEASK
jgi:hypothetical protein